MIPGGMRVRAMIVSGVLTVLCVAPATDASAAVTIGSMQPPPPPNATSCSSPRGTVQTTPPAGDTYTAPVDGVITWFTFQGASLPPPAETKLLVLDTVGGPNYRLAAAGQFEPGVGPTTRTTRLPISAGQVIGAYGFTCVTEPAPPGMTGSFSAPEPPVGATQAFGTVAPGRLLLEATIEPDCDNDGFGDETQDTDLNACPPAPTATITRGPPEKVKTKKKKVKATFEFTANEPGAIFECILDGKQEFRSCTSPLTVTVKKGKHSFSVVAIDAGGHSGTAATDDWKVKRKKKK